MYVNTVVETFGMTGRTFICKHCAFQGQAWVVASGEGEGGGVGRRATSQAARHAADDADRVADQSLLFAECPKCGEKAAAGKGFRIRRLALVFGLPIAAIALGILLSHRMDSPSDLMVILFPGTLAMIVAVQLYFSLRRPWYRAEYRVSFEGFDKPDDRDRWV